MANVPPSLFRVGWPRGLIDGCERNMGPDVRETRKSGALTTGEFEKTEGRKNEYIESGLWSIHLRAVQVLQNC